MFCFYFNPLQRTGMFPSLEINYSLHMYVYRELLTRISIDVVQHVPYYSCDDTAHDHVGGSSLDGHRRHPVLQFAKRLTLRTLRKNSLVLVCRAGPY
jgi:hypothetical protein